MDSETHFKGVSNHILNRHSSKNHYLQPLRV
jgi:hypothetical protein